VPIVQQCVLVKAKKIRLFIKPYCGWCHKASRWLDERGIEYEAIDVISDEAAYDEMIRLSGQELAPVIEVDGEILADFGPDQLAEFWRQLEKKDARTGAR
jgi:glutaredoxin 3